MSRSFRTIIFGRVCYNDFQYYDIPFYFSCPLWCDSYWGSQGRGNLLNTHTYKIRVTRVQNMKYKKEGQKNAETQVNFV